MQYEVEYDTGTLIIYLPKEIDHHSSQKIKEDTEQLLHQQLIREIIFDFQDTIFMDSSGIGMILGRCKNLQFEGGQVRAVHLNKQMERIFRISGLHKVIAVAK